MREPTIAGIHDRQTSDDPLTSNDLAIVRSQLAALNPEPGAGPNPVRCVADFGCGTGRTFSGLRGDGWQVLGVDLSLPMLQAARNRIDRFCSDASPEGSTAGAKGPGSAGDPLLLQLPLTAMRGIADQSLSAGICLYSTLGMIRGRANRRLFLGEAFRLIRAGGLFVVHAHNVWHQRRFPGGRRWLFRSGCAAILGRGEFGDRWANACGVSRLYIHAFRWSSFLLELRNAGLKPLRYWSHDSALHGSPPATDPGPGRDVDSIPRSGRWNATGWIVVCERAGEG